MAETQKEGSNVLGTLIGILGPFLLQKLFGGGGSGGSDQTIKSNNNNTSTTSTTTPARGYQSPLLGGMDLMTGNMLGQNLKRMSGFGYPEGAGLDTGMVDDILSLIGKEWPKMMEGYKTVGDTAPTFPKTAQGVTDERNLCSKRCLEFNKYGEYPQFKTCMDACAKVGQ